MSAPAPERERRRMAEVLRRLRRAYPEARLVLRHGSPWQLLVAVVLSAQSTDAQVNKITRALFERYPTPEALLAAPEPELVRAIFSSGFHNQKARALRGAAEAILERHGGEVPASLEELDALPGVGRKTAAVVSGNAFGRNDGIAVDTHVRRIVRRLGFTTESDPDRIERVLMQLVPRRLWTDFTHLLIAHGRATCTARAPRCPECVLLSLCPEGRERTGRRRRKLVTRSQP